MEKTPLFVKSIVYLFLFMQEKRPATEANRIIGLYDFALRKKGLPLARHAFAWRAQPDDLASGSLRRGDIHARDIADARLAVYVGMDNGRRPHELVPPERASVARFRLKRPPFNDLLAPTALVN